MLNASQFSRLDAFEGRMVTDDTEQGNCYIVFKINYEDETVKLFNVNESRWKEIDIDDLNKDFSFMYNENFQKIFNNLYMTLPVRKTSKHFAYDIYFDDKHYYVDYNPKNKDLFNLKDTLLNKTIIENETLENIREYLFNEVKVPF